MNHSKFMNLQRFMIPWRLIVRILEIHIYLEYLDIHESFKNSCIVEDSTREINERFMKPNTNAL